MERLEDRCVPSATFIGDASLGSLTDFAASGPALVRPLNPTAAQPLVIVQPGQSIQAAIDMAKPKAVILIAPGTYRESLTIATPNLHLIGMVGAGGDGVVLENPGGAGIGITVTSTAGGFELHQITIRDFDQNGVFLDHVDKFVIDDVTAIDDGDYGIFPVHANHGLIENCTATGHTDTGIYVGQSQNIMVRSSRTFANVIGLEVENSSNVWLVPNESFDNTSGILVDLLPGLELTTASSNVVAVNFVHDNNRPNFAPPGDLASFLPAGTGILILGADQTTVKANLETRLLASRSQAV
jgi:parallel beta-helix repeat protein